MTVIVYVFASCTDRNPLVIEEQKIDFLTR